MLFMFLFSLIISFFQFKAEAAPIDIEATFTEFDNVTNHFLLDGVYCNTTDLNKVDANLYVCRDYNPNYFSNFTLNVDVKLNSSEDGVPSVFLVFANSLGDVTTVGTELCWHFYRSGANYFIYNDEDPLIGGKNDAKAINVNTFYYLNITRLGSTVTTKIYSDSARTVLLNTMILSGLSTTTWRYIYVAQSWGAGAGKASFIVFNLDFSITGPPIVSTSDATLVEENTARLNGEILNMGNYTPCNVNFSYGFTTAYGNDTTRIAYTNLTTFNENISGLTTGALYHFIANANNTYGNSTGNDKTFLTKPEAPNNLNITIVNSTHLRFNWTKGTGANNTYVVENSNNIPTSKTDGTIIYNGTGLNVDRPIASGETKYYRTWSYTGWLDPNLYQFSDNSTNFTTGGLYINCFDAVTGLPIQNWNVFISDINGTTTYAQVNCNNTLNINISLFPFGVNTVIILNHSWYNNQTYYLDIYPSGQYILNAHLYEFNITTLYQLQVVGPITDYDANPPVQGAKVTINKYMNETVGYETAYILLSDANGYCYASLFPNTPYKVNITKTGYTDSISDFTPLSAVLSYTFRIYPSGSTLPTYTLWVDTITFTATMQDTGYDNLSNITIYYSDSNLSTTNTQVYLYENNNGTITLIASYSNATDSWTNIVSSINSSRDYFVVLFFNNTADFMDANSPMVLNIYHLYIYTSRTKFDFNDRVTKLIGPLLIQTDITDEGTTVSWSVFVAMGFGIALLLMFSQYHIGVAIISCGLGIGFMQGFFSMWFNDTFPIGLGLLVGLLIFVGILWIWTNRGGDMQL